MNCPETTQIHKLELVFPPISNQEADWLKKDIEVIEVLQNSNLYMIVQHSEFLFIFDKDPQNNIHNEILCGTVSNGELYSNFEIDLKYLYNEYKIEFDLGLGEKIIKIIEKEKDTVIGWFTPEKLAFDKSKESPFIKGLDEFRQILTFKLHYIGLSIENDSFTRLVINAHSARISILSNENPLKTGARVTDEVFLLFFRIPSTEIKTYDWDQIDEFVKNFGRPTTTKNEIITDAEKAFINILKPYYNSILYSYYPESKDGLFKYILNGYLFFIGESLVLQTDTQTIRGNYTEYDLPGISDCIMIKDNTVSFFKSEDDSSI